MASSGRVPVEVLEYMKQTIVVSTATPNTSLYGKRIDGGASRSVACLLEPAMSASRTHEFTDVTYSWDLYCDDVDIVETDMITLPNGVKPAIVGIETYCDEEGALYQVVHC